MLRFAFFLASLGSRNPSVRLLEPPVLANSSELQVEIKSGLAPTDVLRQTLGGPARGEPQNTTVLSYYTAKKGPLQRSSGQVAAACSVPNPVVHIGWKKGARRCKGGRAGVRAVSGPSKARRACDDSPGRSRRGVNVRAHLQFNSPVGAAELWEAPIACVMAILRQSSAKGLCSLLKRVCL